MGLFDRLGTIVKAKANGVVEALEGDGLEVMEQEIVEAKKEYAQLKTSAATVKAQATRYETDMKKHLEMADKLHSSAAAQLRQGNEEAARNLLEAEKKERAEAEELAPLVENFKQKTKEILERLDAYGDQIKDAEKVYRETKVNVSVAKATEAVSDGAVDTKALNRFNRHAERSRERLEVSQARMEINDLESSVNQSSEDLLKQYGTSDTDADLDALRKELGI